MTIYANVPQCRDLNQELKAYLIKYWYYLDTLGDRSQTKVYMRQYEETFVDTW